jgi:N-acetylgalactosamine kinase
MREVKEWFNWVEANEWRQWAMGVYGKAWEGRFSPFKTLLTATAKRFGESAQVFLVRAPGRLNLMGRHIDHRGGFVHPIALPREILLTVRPRDDDIVIAHHAEPEKFSSHAFRFSEVAPTKPLSVDEWERWTREKATQRKTFAGWAIYAEAAVATIVNWHKEFGISDLSSLRGLEAVVYGDIPPEAGLSSSSALFVAFLVALLHRNIGASLDTRSLPPEICGYGEWYVGTRGGAGDHAAILLAETGKVMRIGFFPMNFELLPFPEELCLLVMDSGERAHKAGGARAEFNRRVAAYEVGMMIWHERFPELRERLRYLRDAAPSRLGDEGLVYRLLKALPRYATFDELVELFPNRKDRLLQLAATCQAEGKTPFNSSLVPRPSPLEIRGACWFGVAECERSEMFRQVLREGDIDRIGELMTVSHDGDRVTRWRDSEPSPFQFPTDDFALEAFEQNKVPIWKQAGSYRCSTPTIDFIVDTALRVGALGAQLSGAGLGGCAMALVRRDEAEKIAERIASNYQRALGMELSWFIAEPCKGAQVLSEP